MIEARPDRGLRRTALLVLLAAAMFTPSIVGRELLPPDEPRFALIARELYERGDWIDPTRFGAPYLDKPPLLFWLQAAAFAIHGGPSPAAARWPSLLATLALVALLHRAARRWLEEPRATHAVLIYLTTPLVLARGAWAATDPLLVTCVFAAGVYWRRAEERIDAGAGSARAIAVAMGCAALGILTKGPVALLWLVLAWCAARLTRSGWWRLRTVLHPSATSLLLLLAPWPVAYALRHGARPLISETWHQNIDRALRSWDNLEPWWYFVPALLGGLLPLSIALLPALRDRWRQGGPTRTWLVLIAIAALGFSLPAGKRGVYLLPLYPWAALVFADAWQTARGRPTAARCAAAVSGALAAILCVVALLSPQLATALRMPAPQLALTHLGPVFVFAALGLAGSSWCFLRRRPLPMLPAALACGVIGLTTPWTLTPLVNQVQSASSGARALARVIVSGAPVGVTDTKPELLAWYGPLAHATLLRDRAEQLRFLRERPDAFLIGKRAELERLRERLPAHTVLATARIGRAELAVLGPSP